MSLLEFRDVSKRYPDGTREIRVLDRVSFCLEEGEAVGLLATRRMGKTTLLRIAAGLVVPDSGSVLWQGRDLRAMSVNERARIRRRDGVALASGDWRVGRSVSVLEHVAMPLYGSSMTMAAAEARSWRALEWVQASQLGYRETGTLGLSERLRVELARALVREPRLLLMDEPAVLPQPQEARAFHALLHALPQRLGFAVLVASEEVSALRGVRRVMSLDHGTLHSTDSRRKVIDFPERRASKAPRRRPDAS
jgi:ABC-type methionine transport system ATPase subunit